MERYEKIESVSEQELKKIISDTFPIKGADKDSERVKLYAVLDFAVCFGIFMKEQIYVGLDGKTQLQPVDWRYLQELRVFDGQMELYAVPAAGRWSGRIRREIRDNENAKASKEYVIVEDQKLWGKISHDITGGIPNWSLLTSQRGTRIWIPVAPNTDEAEEMALKICRIMRIPDMEKEQELVYQKDFCIVDICVWKGEGYEEFQQEL